MDGNQSPIIAWIDSQAPAMAARLVDWANINSGSANAAGLDRFRAAVRPELEKLGGEVREIELSPGGVALSALKRPEAATRVFLCIHLDTVYGVDHPFQTCTRLDANTLQGPGVADAKGGLIVMLTALAALEQSPLAAHIGWEVLLNPDEEVGSMASLPLLTAATQRNQFGLLFEPATADGALIDRRKGSGTFAVTVHGRSAHAGRDFAHGRNAVVVLARLVVSLDAINGEMDGVTLNVGKVEGGGPSNVVPDLATVLLNVRTTVPEDEQRVLNRMAQLLDEANRHDGITAELTGRFTSPPKIPDAPARALMSLVDRCGAELNLSIRWKSSGGTCDGNKLAAAGLANVDTLGPCGGNLHSPTEFVLLDTLAVRAKLAALVLLKLAAAAGEGKV